MNEAILIRFQPIPLNQDVEQRHGPADPALEIGPNAVGDLFEMTNERQHREDRLNHHPLVPGALGTDFKIGRHPAHLFKMGVGKDDHLLGDRIHQMLEGSAIVDIGCVHIPADNQTEVVQEEAELAPNYPALVGQPFLADLLRAASLAPGMNQFDAVTVNDAEQRRRGQKAVNPLLMRVEEAKQPCSMRQVRKQMRQITLDPAVEGPVAHPLEGKQQSQRDHFTGIQPGLGMLPGLRHLVVHTAEQFYGKILIGKQTYICHGEVLLRLAVCFSNKPA
jgi:hypothetical protein